MSMIWSRSKTLDSVTPLSSLLGLVYWSSEDKSFSTLLGSEKRGTSGSVCGDFMQGNNISKIGRTSTVHFTLCRVVQSAELEIKIWPLLQVIVHLFSAIVPTTAGGVLYKLHFFQMQKKLFIKVYWAHVGLWPLKSADSTVRPTVVLWKCVETPWTVPWVLIAKTINHCRLMKAGIATFIQYLPPSRGNLYKQGTVWAVGVGDLRKFSNVQQNTYKINARIKKYIINNEIHKIWKKCPQ